MRRMTAILITLAWSRAHADSPDGGMRPTVALRAGVHHTNLSLEVIDGLAYGTGVPRGNGFATELEAGLWFHPQWGLSGFVDYASFSTQLSFEYPEPITRHVYVTDFDHLYIGARVNWRPISWLSIGGGIAWVEVWQRNRPADSGGEPFDSHWHTSVPQLAMTIELVRTDPFSVQLSVGLAGNPFASAHVDHIDYYVPVFVGLAWDGARRQNRPALLP